MSNKSKRKEKGVDLLLSIKRELTRTRLKTVRIMEIQEMEHQPKKAVCLLLKP